jgi:hypothetical protein
MSSIDDIPIQSDPHRTFPVAQSVGIGISVVALGISMLSFWDSRKNAQLQGELARPQLELSKSAMRISRSKPSVWTLVELKNVGHLGAEIKSYDVETDITGSGVYGEDFDKCVDMTSRLRMHKAVPVEPTLPGDSREIEVELPLPSVCTNVNEDIVVRITFNYEDTIGSKSFRQPISVSSARKQ